MSYQAALGTRLTILAFVARHTDDVGASRYEAVCANLLMTGDAHETLSMPLAPSVFILLHAYSTAIKIFILRAH